MSGSRVVSIDTWDTARDLPGDPTPIGKPHPVGVNVGPPDPLHALTAAHQMTLVTLARAEAAQVRWSDAVRDLFAAMDSGDDLAWRDARERLVRLDQLADWIRSDGTQGQRRQGRAA